MMHKKVLIIIHHLCRGGAEKSAAVLASSLTAHCDVHVVTFFSESYYPSTYKLSCSHVCLDQKPSGGSILKSLKNFFNRIVFIHRYKKKYGIDVSISFLKSADIVNVLSSFRSSKVVSLRTSLPSLMRGRNRFLYSIIFRLSHRITVQTEHGRSYLIERLRIQKRKIDVIPNSYDVSDIRKHFEDSRVVYSRFSGLKMISIGRFYSIKGHVHMFRILRRLLDTRAAKLVLVGEGDELGYYLDYCKSLSLKAVQLAPEDHLIDLSLGDVFFVGYTNNPYQYLREADVFLSASYFEGFPNAIAEALICGKYVISSDCLTGPAELLGIDRSSIDRYPVSSPRGLLLPVLRNQGCFPKDPISDEEGIWIETLENFVLDNRFSDLKGSDSEQKGWPYSYEQAANLWCKVLNL